MLTDLETRLADVLGARLAAPFTGRVFVAPGPDDAQLALLVGVREAAVVDGTFGAGRRPEVVPGADDPRRVVRLRTKLRVEVRPGAAGTRPQTLAALDALIYELDSPELRSAAALAAAGDPGFLLTEQLPRAAVVVPVDVRSELPAVELEAVGWFWPRNTPGITGVAIAQALVRTAALPVALAPWPLHLRAGDPTLALTIRVGTTGTTTLSADAPTVSAFGALAVRVVDSGGRPGAGTLSGGTPGPNGSQLVPVDLDVATVTYQPPAAAAADVLVVHVGRADSGAGPAIGMELARFPLEVTG